MHVFFTCGREGQYPRNEALVLALQRDFQVTSFTDNHLRRSILSRSIRLFIRVLNSRVLSQSNVLVVGFYGHLLIPMLKMVTRKPILFDVLTSTYDTLCFDRQRFRPNSLAGRTAFHLDRFAFKAAHGVLVDTKAHARFLIDTFGLNEAQVHVLYLGCPDPSTHLPPATPSSRFTIFTVTGFLPLHGLETIVKAASFLPEVHFILAGEGPLLTKIKNEVHQKGLTNVLLPGRIPYHELAAHMSHAEVCLGGHFSKIPKALRVIPNKVFQFLSHGKTTIVGDTPANREVLDHGEHVFMCAPADPEGLAGAINTLMGDKKLRDHLAVSGQRIYQQRLSVAAAAKTLKGILHNVPLS